ncbi:hypothetical protein PPSIR1_38941 [Plesiocystis pacifica SIR-1]|uniref:B12-binding domain-containing protein n=1 Tax=Plesiocystis pacifica SIR-1 TaxID=391625 RepID=A6GGD9_9BACT|nr:RiPP maturation radical SAM C-methyltransferase [Plesiocystis pacifica]EDM75060.1 hypothetical protein PPSIR1_38941 [Plesiocystis pacifica SIR-1]
MSSIPDNFPLGPCDALIIIPPFGDIEQPFLGAHILQALARQAGFELRVLYANLLFAHRVGSARYRDITHLEVEQLFKERVFAARAFGASGLNARELGVVGLGDDAAVQALISAWVTDVVALALSSEAWVLGCTTTFEQSSAAIALLDEAKRAAPERVTILGGANCEDEMARGLLSLNAAVDFIFSGESEATFPAFLSEVLGRGHRPEQRVFHGQPCLDLEALPLTSFDDFFEQRAALFPDEPSETVKIPYETSRGCWWGQKHHCTFCGLNGGGMGYREKSADKVFRDLNALHQRYAYDEVMMVDNIMPHGYFKSFVPRAAEELPPGTRIFYEQKANITLRKAMALKRAGIDHIQPGIESLSTALLRRMDKGIKASQNIALMRYARAVGLQLVWNLLVRFPGDREEDYEGMIELIPLLAHLRPSAGVHQVSFDRFSPYFSKAREHGLRNLRPWPAYAEVYPEHADIEALAYHFDADVVSAVDRKPALVTELARLCTEWESRWQVRESVPRLQITPLFGDQYVLVDTRGLPGVPSERMLTHDEASLLLVGGAREDRAQAAWAVDNKWLVELDGRLVPLAIAPPAVFLAFEEASARVIEEQERFSLPVL